MASSWTTRSAEIVFHDGIPYVEIYADETDRSVDLPDLAHNRCLSLERIQNIVELPGDTRWRDDLATTEATIKIAAPLLKFYKLDHPEIEPIPVDKGKAFLVTRKIRFSWWFLRDLLERGFGFEVVSPPALRQKMCETLEELLQAHQ